ncbi:MAG: PQQ-binding-like beta-propeller repeat protein [Treponema sp.]|jgi:outer membrane protein assembly factor BamB|nr:PQQ-binding-like beta-propeller repeat protein [Treponema sp.]
MKRDVFPGRFAVCAVFSLVSSLLAAQDTGMGPLSADPLWRQALGGEVTGLPAAQVHSAVVVLDGGNIKAYSDRGRPLWTYSARGRLSPYVARSREGTCYISRTNGTFIAVNRAGRELWRAYPGGPLSGNAVPGWDGRVYVPTGGRISCYTASGCLLWRRDLAADIALSPRLDQNGGILAVLENGDLVRADPFGRILSRRLSEVPRAVLSMIPSGEKGNIETWGRTLVLYASGRVEMLDPARPGGRPYVFPRLPSPPLAAASRENTAAAILQNGEVILISGTDGAFIWTGKSHLAMERSGSAVNRTGDPGDNIVMLYDERGVYVLSKSGATGFTEDGRRLWYIHLEGAAAVPAFGDEGVLYSGGADWILYAYKLEDRVRQGRESLYGPVPEGSYGTGNPPPSSWADEHYRFEEESLDREFDRIEAALKSGEVGENELEYTAYLMEAAGSSADLLGPAKARPPVQVRYRVRALRLLSVFGSSETIPFLIKVFTRDDEAPVKAAAAMALGAIGLDPDGAALRAFAAALYSPVILREEQVLTAIASASGALCRFSGPPLSDTGVKILTALAGDTPPPSVRARARRELDTLRP